MKTIMHDTTVTTARSLIIQSGIQSVFNDERPLVCKRNNEKSLVFTTGVLRPIKAFSGQAT